MKVKIRIIPVLTTSLILGAGVVLAMFANESQKQKAYAKLVSTATIKQVKVFQIGFSKCGTTTINDFFNRNGVPSVHHDRANLARTIYANYERGKPLLSRQYEKYAVFTDMEAIYLDPQLKVAQDFFKEFDRQYPGSKFILNTRNKEAWLKSRALQPIQPKKIPLIEISANILNISQDEVLAQWSTEWDEHHKAVLEYFKDRPNDLLVFDLENDPPEKMTEFFKDYFILNHETFGKKNQTAYRWVREKFNELRGNGEKNGILLSKSYPLTRASN